MLDKTIQEYELTDLNKLYTDAEDCDKKIFAEMRTNLQLVSGDHYTREGSRYWNRIRDDKSLTSEQRLRLVKNHTQRVTKIYRNSIESFAPGVHVQPANEKELKDQKVAEMHQSYWAWTCEKENFAAKRSTWIMNFVEIGEIFTKVFWETTSGNIIGYEAQTGEPNPAAEGQEPQVQVDDSGNPVQDQSKPVYGGRIRWQTLEAYNVRRDKDARSLNESPYLILSSIMSKQQLMSLVKDPALRKELEKSSSKEYTLFDNSSGYYKSSPNQCLLKEIYFRPAPAIPNGYYFIYNDEKIIDKGELPYGIWPIVYTGFDEQTGNARHHTVIRHIRPGQVEVNRCASKIAEHQVVNGDDKIWIQQNAKISPGATLPGIRTNYYTGAKPEVTPGRTGDQYLDYMLKCIDEIYLLANLKEILEENNDNNQDMYTSLLKSFRFKRKFAIYGEKIERFLIELCKTSMAIAKHSASEHDIIPAIGKSETINMPEFKSAEDICYQVKVVPQSEDIESQFGKQITLNHILQYVGNSLGKEEIGQMIRLSPFLNKEQSLQRFTMKWDNVTNDVLAMDRGQFRPANKYDDHDYYISALTFRMSQGDYEYLSPVIQHLYEMKLQQHEQIKAQNLQDIQRAEAGFIPTSGYMAKCDLYMGDVDDPAKVKRITLPSDAISWLVKALQNQGTAMQPVRDLPTGAGADISRLLGGPPAQQLSPGTGAPNGAINA